MGTRDFKGLLCTLWICGFFAVDDPMNAVGVRLFSKKGIRIRRILILAWSLLLIVYPPLFFLDIVYHTGVGIPQAANGNLSAVIPWFGCVVSQFIINVIARVFSMLNSGKVTQLLDSLRALESNTDGEMATGSEIKWRFNRLVWLLYAAQVAGELSKVVRHLVTNEYPMKGLKLLLVPNDSDTLRILIMHFVSINETLSPMLLFHFVVKFGSNLIEMHGSICTELHELLQRSSDTDLTSETKMVEPRGELQSRVLRMQEEFTSLKECFKVYEQLAGVFVFCILWWIFVVIITTFSSLSADDLGNDLTRLDVAKYAVCSTVFIYMVASFGEYMACSIEHGREIVSNALGLPGDSTADNEILNMERLAKWILRWKWELTAVKCFTINYRILPAFAGTIMTYYIFIFQLMLSEKEVGTNVTIQTNH